MDKNRVAFIERVSKHWFLRNLFAQDVLEYIACQFALESNFGTSSLCIYGNNYTGMRVPHKRLSYCRPHTIDEFANYDDFDTCVIDYYAWVLYQRPYDNVRYDLDAFRIMLCNSGYCPEKGYIDKINLIYKQFKSYKNGQIS